MAMKAGLLSIYQKLYSGFGPQHWWPGDSPFEVAVGAILTQNTNWENVAKAIGNLKEAKKLSPRALRELALSDLAAMIRPAGYYNVKAKRLRNFLDFLFGTYRGSMALMKEDNANTVRERLLGVSGIGPETADSILLYALEKPYFVIDAYTKRVLSRHNIIEEDAPYQAYQNLFHNALEEDPGLFNEYHALFVRVCKENCRTKPDCGGCPLRGV